jgi:methyl-accepting chemotaxis protein
MAGKLFRRRVYLIDKRLQLRFTGLVVALVVVYSLFLGGATYLNYKISCIVFDNTSLYDAAVEQSIRAEGRKTLITTTVFLVINGLVVGLVFVVLTHKVAGPLYRIRRHIAEIQGGRLPQRIMLRKGDELGHVANGVNEMTESLRAAAQQDVKDLGGVAIVLQGAMEELRRGGPPGAVAGKLDEAMKRVTAVSAARQKLLGG